MSTRGGSRVGPILIAAGSFALAGLVGYIDGRSSAYIAFSIFYLVPVFLATWFVNRATGVSVAVHRDEYPRCDDRYGAPVAPHGTS